MSDPPSGQSPPDLLQWVEAELLERFEPLWNPLADLDLDLGLGEDLGGRQPKP